MNEREEREERLDARLRDAAREYNRPPDTPREELWARIDAARRGEPTASAADDAAAGPSGRAADGRPTRASITAARWVRWGMGLAAALVVGIGIGRLSAPALRPDAGPTASVPPAADAGTARQAAGPYRYAAADLLTQAEALLTTVGTSRRAPAVDAATVEWARDMLSTTRLLLDSPAAEDPHLRGLLQDVELTLAQIVQLPAGGAAARAWFRATVEQRDVLTRLRAATAPEPARTET